MSTYLEYLNRTPLAIEPGQTVEVVPFEPKYAEAFCRCYHQVYRDTFPVKYVYEPDQVIAMVERDDLISMLAVTPKGEVVGMTNAFHFSPNRRNWEIGGTMVLEAYRKGDLANPLINRICSTLRGLAPDAIYGTVVCNHLYTQYASRKLSMIFTALDLDGFTNYESGVAIDTSLLFVFSVYNKNAQSIHLLECYCGIAEESYQLHQVPRQISSAIVPSPIPHSQVQVQCLSRSLRMTVELIGADLPDLVMTAWTEHPECQAMQVCLPLEQESAPWAAKRLREYGYFYSGVLPLWSVSDALVLQRTRQPPAFEKLVLGSAFAKRLRDFIREDYTQVSEKNKPDR